LDNDSYDNDDQSHSLDASEALVKKNITHENIHQGIDVIAKSGFGGAALLNRPDVKAPVEDDQRRTEG